MTDHALAPSDPAAYRAHLARLGVTLPLRADDPDTPGCIYGAGAWEVITVDPHGALDDEEARELAQLVAATINRAAGIEP